MQELDPGTKQPSPSSNQNIFSKFLEMNKRNEDLKAVTYIEFQKKTSSSKNMFLSTLDNKKGEFKLAFLEPKASAPRDFVDYKTYVLYFNTKQIHPIEQSNLHRQTREMIYFSLTSSPSNVSKLHNSLNNTIAKLKTENTSSLEKDIRIKSLDDLVIKLCLDPKNVDASQEIVQIDNISILSQNHGFLAQLMFAYFYQYFEGILILLMFANFYRYFPDSYNFLVFQTLINFIMMLMFATLVRHHLNIMLNTPK